MHKAGKNVAMSQRRDVGSTRIEVNKRQRHDVSAIFASPSLKEKGGPEIEASKDVVRRHGKESSNDLDPWRRDLLLYFLLF